MSNFLKLRLSTLLWGFSVSLVFTGELVTSVAMWSVVVAGNTVLMRRYAGRDVRSFLRKYEGYFDHRTVELGELRRYAGGSGR